MTKASIRHAPVRNARTGAIGRLLSWPGAGPCSVFLHYHQAPDGLWIPCTDAWDKAETQLL